MMLMYQQWVNPNTSLASIDKVVETIENLSPELRDMARLSVHDSILPEIFNVVDDIRNTATALGEALGVVIRHRGEGEQEGQNSAAKYLRELWNGSSRGETPNGFDAPLDALAAHLVAATSAVHGALVHPRRYAGDASDFALTSAGQAATDLASLTVSFNKAISAVLPGVAITKAEMSISQ
jgi:hypothetical protein